MPTTVNGIGTHYYGKHNRASRMAACKSCGKTGVLESYDTRLWFVIVFIPIIPLGRKRIIDECPRCRRHFVADLEKFEQARQLQSSAALEHFRRERSTEAALTAHAQLLAFHDNEQAAGVRQTVLASFPTDAVLRANLAAQLEHFALHGESLELYEAAWKLDPELPDARAGVARRRMAQGELDQARQLLSFLETPGAGTVHSLAPLDVLSSYYQKAGRHEEALDLAAILVREIPDAGQGHAFRAFVQRSEKALGRWESILPPRRHSLRGLLSADGSSYAPWLRKAVIGGGAVVLVTAGLLISNEYIRTHRVIHVASACEKPVQISVDGGPPIAFSNSGKLSVAEGRHRITMTGAVEDTSEINVRAGFFDRWFKKPLWVLNPGGEAVLRDATVYYAQHPQPSSYRLSLGRNFVALPHVDYAFDDPPDQLKVKNQTQQLEKRAFSWVQGQDSDAFLEVYDQDQAAALSFAERRLRRFPENNELLTAYIGKTLPQEAARVEEFLKTGLDRRPAAVAWHRTYQVVAEMSGHATAILALYDGYLNSDPSNGALLYLRGRIDPDWNKQEDYFRRSAKADPRLPWPWMALGLRAAGAARWDDCLRDLQRAQQLKIPAEYIADELHAAAMAKGDSSSLVAEYQRRLTANPMDFAAVSLLFDALVAAKKESQLEPALTAWASRLEPNLQNLVVPAMRALAYYEQGKLDECEKLCQQDMRLRSSALHAHVFLAQGRAKEAAELFSASPTLGGDPWFACALSLGLFLDGQKAKAEESLSHASAKLEKLYAEFVKTAKILQASEPVPVDALARLSIDPAPRALVFAILAQRFPEKKDEYLAAARRFNIEHKPPYHLVRSAIAGAKPARP
jgi:tetratricopeptide (TPR) repeat protein